MSRKRHLMYKLISLVLTDLVNVMVIGDFSFRITSTMGTIKLTRTGIYLKSRFLSKSF